MTLKRSLIFLNVLKTSSLSSQMILEPSKEHRLNLLRAQNHLEVEVGVLLLNKQLQKISLPHQNLAM